jgi:hypothetical protein
VSGLFRAAAAIDRRLMAMPRWSQRTAIGITCLVILGVGIRNVPRAYIDFRGVPGLQRIAQHETYGTDTIADMYEARVVVNDVRDMYTKKLVDQTPLEAASWSKAASAPYPPAALLISAALYAIGNHLGIGFYGMVLGLAIGFLGVSAYYCLQTRWYVFPAMYLNFSYLGERFVYVQDGSYLIMLVLVLMALLLARRRLPSAHALMAVATIVKLSPLYYVKNVTTMPRAHALAYLAILAAGLVLPIAIWANYLYIFEFQQTLKGGISETIAAVLVSIPVSLVVWYVETRLGFDLEDRVGWGLVPFALFLGLKTNTARHLVLALLIPDKRGIRNIAAGIGLALPALFPGVIRLNSALLICAGLVILGLIYYLDAIGWDVVRADARQPIRTFRMMLKLQESGVRNQVSGLG